MHHTAGANGYTAAQSAAIVRAIQIYHVKGNGWNDIGYNFLVDKYGQVFEGRYGGVERNVIGAHAEGFNTGSVGIALLGTYGDTKPTAKALDAIAALIAWRLDVAHVDPASRLSWISGGNARFPSGTPVPLAAVTGHRDTGPTSCPGNALHAQLPAIARKAAAIGLPKLYEPFVSGTPGGLVRFTARLSSARPWTVRVTDTSGAPVASGTGDGRERRLDVGRHVRRADRVHVLDRGRSGRAAGDRNDRPGRDVADDDRRTGEARDVHAERRQPGRLDGDQLHAEPRVDRDRDASGRVGGDARNAVRRAEEGRPAVVQVHGDRCSGRSVLGRAEREGAERTRGERGRADRRRQDARGVRGLAGGLLAERGPADSTSSGSPSCSQHPRTSSWSRARSSCTKAISEPGRRSSAGTAACRDGKYAAVLEATGLFGTRGQTARFAADTKKPVFRLLSKAQRRFTVNEQVTVTGTVGGVRVRAVVGPGRFSLSGGRGLIAVTAWDAAGNRTTIRQR